MKTISNSVSWAGVLREVGVRLTLPRRAVIRVLSEHREGLTPEEIWRLGRKIHPGLGLVTVYRTVDLFEKLDIVRQVHFGGSRNCIRAKQGDTHFVVCSMCGRVTEFPCYGLASLYGHVRAKTGYTATGHILEISGICPSCMQDRKGDV